MRKKKPPKCIRAGDIPGDLKRQIEIEYKKGTKPREIAEKFNLDVKAIYNYAHSRKLKRKKQKIEEKIEQKIDEKLIKDGVTRNLEYAQTNDLLHAQLLNTLQKIEEQTDLVPPTILNDMLSALKKSQFIHRLCDGMHTDSKKVDGSMKFEDFFLEETEESDDESQ